MKKELIASAILVTAFCVYIDFLVPDALWLSLAKAAFESDSFRFILAITVLPLTTSFVGLKIENFLQRKRYRSQRKRYCSNPHSNRVCCNLPERLSEKHNG